jgi:ferredoxin
MEHAASEVPGDRYLEERLERYERWIREGRIPFSSRVIPVRESLVAQPWVLPTAQVLAFLRNARLYALAPCACRSRYQRCDHSLETCFFINDAAERYVAEGIARPVSLQEAAAVLRRANEEGLVHLTIYNPEQHVYAVCSCCSCCCHDLQFLRTYGRKDMVARSDYVARTDMEMCSHCGACVERCVFGARTWQEGQMCYHERACFGCGLCVTCCPEGATTMQRRSG